MALNATIYSFDVQLADADRGVYSSMVVRMAQHPSEATDFLVARLLAYCLEYTEGIEFSKGLSTPDEPAIAIRDLTGALRAWVDIGVPSAARLHRASKTAQRVAVYTHKPPTLLTAALAQADIYRKHELALYEIERSLILELVDRLERRMRLDISVSGASIYVGIGSSTLEGRVQTLSV